MQRSVLLGARRLSLSSRISLALRTELVSESSARRTIALGAHKLDFNAALVGALQYQRAALDVARQTAQGAGR
eukprot:6089297-Pleurochrysis_carterae.AAC.1